MRETTWKRLSVIAVVALLFLGAGLLSENVGSSSQVNWFSAFQWLLVGLTIFLFGMGEMERALKAVAGNKMRGALRAMTANRFKGFLSGLVTTAIIQSSSITTVMLVGFVSAGLMGFAQTIPAIIGAAVGTTVTAQILAFKVTALIPFLVVLGYALMKLQKTQQQKRFGRIVLGFGLLFWGMDLMSGAMSPLRDAPEFISLMGRMENPLVAILIAATFTALVQSSSATIGIIITLALQGLLPLEAGISLVIGANIGTTITAGLAALGKTRDAVRVAVSHTLFKIFGFVLFVGFIPQFAALVRMVSPVAEGSAAEIASALAHQIANAHTIFNITLALLVLPFTGPFAKLVMKIVPQKKEEADDRKLKPKHFLDDSDIEHAPHAAIDGARLEIDRMGRRIERMLNGLLDPLFKGKTDVLINIAEQDDEVDRLYRQILRYLAKIRAAELSDRDAYEIDDVTTTARYIEQIGDLIESNIVPSGIKLAERDIFISDETQKLITKLHDLASRSFTDVLEANELVAKGANDKKTIEHIQGLTRRVIARKYTVTQAMNAIYARTDARLTKAYATESDIVEGLKTIFFISRNIAKALSERHE